jgi:hypothetical protein
MGAGYWPVRSVGPSYRPSGQIGPLTSPVFQGSWNLVLLCSRHDHLLHHPHWHAKLLPDATLEVTDPHGQVRTTTPPDPSRAPPVPLRE